MLGVARHIVAGGLALLAGAALAACGGGISGNAVARVGDSQITRATFAHWMGVAASASSAGARGKPVVPDPPRYTACIAHLASAAAKPAKGQPRPSATQLKSECETQYRSLQQQTLSFLIAADWVVGEAPSLGIDLSDAEVRKQFVTLEKRQFPKSADFEGFLASTGYTVSDLLLRVKLNMLQQRIQQQAAKDAAGITQAQVASYYHENRSRFAKQTLTQVQATIKQQLAAQARQAALGSFVKAFEKRWKARTDCRVGFVVQDCRQYVVPKTAAISPGAPPSAPGRRTEAPATTSTAGGGSG